MKIYFYGGAKIVTGANYLLETENMKILVDCGLVQGMNAEEENYEPLPYDPKEIDVMLLTHGHLDHLGKIPLLIKKGFRGKIYSTPPTFEFAKIILEDAQEIIEEKSQKEGLIPLYLKEDVFEILKHFETIDYSIKKDLGHGLSFRFSDAGHILGSAIIEFFDGDKKVVFSGDLGRGNNPLLNDPTKIVEADYVLIESAYGNRIHEDEGRCKNVLEKIIEETIAKKGVLMIPSFAVERTQELLYHLNELVENHRIPPVKIYIDSPLAIDATNVYKKYHQYLNEDAQSNKRLDDEIFSFPGLVLTRTTQESKTINESPMPKIIIAGSGMSEGGRILHHETRYLSSPHNCLLIVGYQAEGTLGRRILNGDKKVFIHGQEVKVRAKIKAIGCYSGHADQEQLAFWLNNFNKERLKKVFVVQGETEASEVFCEYVKNKLGLEAEVPEPYQAVELW